MQNYTDQRLLYMLGWGRKILGITDPEGIASEGKVPRFFMSPKEDSRIEWMYTVQFQSGEKLNVAGTVMPGERAFITSVRMPVSQKDSVELCRKPSKTLLGALGELSRIPVRLKSSLAAKGLKMAENDVFLPNEFQAFAETVKNALFWGVEDGKKHMQRFQDYSLRFLFDESDGVQETELTARASLEDGKILVKTNVNVFGLGQKKVILERNLGMARGFTAECKVVKDHVQMPSLKVAFDLYDRLETFYTKQRREKKNIGKPKAR